MSDQDKLRESSPEKEMESNSPLSAPPERGPFPRRSVQENPGPQKPPKSVHLACSRCHLPPGGPPRNPPCCQKHSENNRSTPKRGSLHKHQQPYHFFLHTPTGFSKTLPEETKKKIVKRNPTNSKREGGPLKIHRPPWYSRPPDSNRPSNGPEACGYPSIAPRLL